MFFFKCLGVAGFLQLGALYANTRHDLRSEYNCWKSEHSELGKLGVFWDCSGSLRKFLGSKEHLVWLKIDLNAAEIITVQNYKHKKTDVNGSTHIQC